MANLLTLAVTLSMAATPLLASPRRDRLPRLPNPRRRTTRRRRAAISTSSSRASAGSGRSWRACCAPGSIPFTALDSNVAQVDFVRRFGAQIYYGDAGRLDILRAAQADKARAFVLAIDNVEASLRVAEIVRQHFPDLPIYARARDRIHVHKLLDLGVIIIERETFLSALELTLGGCCAGSGFSEAEAKRLLQTFKRQDENGLYDD